MPPSCTISPLKLQLRNAFNLAHGSSTSRTNTLVRVGEGYGEAAVVPYYGVTYESVTADIERTWRALQADTALDGPVTELEESIDRLESLRAPQAATCAIDLALHDLIGKRLQMGLRQYFGIARSTSQPMAPAITSFTIAIDTPSEMARKARESGLPVLKIKLGGAPDDDLERVRQILAATNARLRLDSNSGWDRETAAHLIPLIM